MRVVGAASVLGACLAACALSPADEVTVAVTLPRTPAHWETEWGPAAFAVTVVPAPAGDDCGSCAGGVVHPPGARLALTLPKRPPVAILAAPVWPDGGPALVGEESLRPAGALWPNHLTAAGGRAELVLSFERGVVAWVRSVAWEAGLDDRGFNYDRFEAELAAALPDDPWQIDLRLVLGALARRSMRRSYLRSPALVEVVLPAPPGTWLSPSPFAPPLAGGAPPGALPFGVTAFYSGDGRRLVVDVDAKGRAWMAVSTP